MTNAPKTNLHREGWMILAVMSLLVMASGILLIWPFDPATPLAGAAFLLRSAFIVCLFAIASFKQEKINRFQRIGAALAGALMLLTIQSLLVEDNPNQNWATIGVTLGLIMFALPFAGPALWTKLAKLGAERAARRDAERGGAEG